MLIDAHAHMDVERPHIFTVLCGTDPVGAAQVLKKRCDMVVPCCALHPWYTDRYSVEEMIPFIEQSPVLGEIGLDSEWTDVPMDAQRKAFYEQLILAEKLQKPIVLHTKGMEKEIAETISSFTVRKLVHWYSCMDHLDKYLDLDCYFTVGPDHETNPAVREVIRRAPMERLLTETDGLSAVEWAIGRKAAPWEIENIIQGEIAAIANAKGLSCEETEMLVHKNLMRFIYGTGIDLSNPHILDAFKR